MSNSIWILISKKNRPNSLQPTHCQSHTQSLIDPAISGMIRMTNPSNTPAISSLRYLTLVGCPSTLEVKIKYACLLHASTRSLPKPACGTVSDGRDTALGCREQWLSCCCLSVGFRVGARNDGKITFFVILNLIHDPQPRKPLDPSDCGFWVLKVKSDTKKRKCRKRKECKQKNKGGEFSLACKQVNKGRKLRSFPILLV